MNFLQRLAARALVGIIPPTASADVVRMLGGIFPGSVGAPPVRGTREQLLAYTSSPWLRAVVGRISEGVAATQWQLFVAAGARKGTRDRLLQRAPVATRSVLLKQRRDEDGVREIENHVMLDLLDTANLYHTGYQMRALTQQHLDLVGEAWWWKERNGMGAPVAVWAIPAHWITGTPTPSHRMVRVSYRGWQGEIPDTEFLWFAHPNPENPYGRGSGIGQTLADELETDEYAAKLERQKFFNQARPDFIVFPEGDDAPGRPATWNDAQRLRLEQEWTSKHQGLFRAFKPMFATRKLGIHEFKADDFRALQMVQLREYERDIILHTYGLPPELLGILQSSNRSTIDAAKYLFDTLMIVPRLEFMRTVLQERLVPEYDEKLIVDYVSPVQADPATALEAAKIAPWSLDVDEWRARANLPPLDGDKGKVHLVPSGYTAVDADGLGEIKPPVPVAPTAADKAWMSEGGGLAFTEAEIAAMSTEELIALRDRV